MFKQFCTFASLLYLFISFSNHIYAEKVLVENIVSVYSINVGKFIIPKNSLLIKNLNGTISIPSPRLTISSDKDSISYTIASFKYEYPFEGGVSTLYFKGDEYYCSLLGMKVISKNESSYIGSTEKISEYLEIDKDGNFLKFGSSGQAYILSNLICGFKN